MSQLRLSGTMIEDANESVREDVNPFEESANNRSLAEESQHKIVDLLDKALNGEDVMSEISESDGESLENESNISSLNTSRRSTGSSSSCNRRKSYRRKSSFGGEIRAELVASIRRQQMDPKQLAILFRKYYEQEKELNRLDTDLEEMELPIDIEKMSFPAAVQEFVNLMSEVQGLQDQIPDKIAHNHQADLDHVLMILKNEYNKVDSLTSIAAAADDDVILETEEQKAMIAAAVRIRSQIIQIEALKEEVREKMEEVRILEGLPSVNNRTGQE